MYPCLPAWPLACQPIVFLKHPTHSPGHWHNRPADMLEVGSGALTLQDQRSHFALWAAVKSPLIIGTDLRRVWGGQAVWAAGA